MMISMTETYPLPVAVELPPLPLHAALFHIGQDQREDEHRPEDVPDNRREKDRDVPLGYPKGAHQVALKNRAEDDPIRMAVTE
jgi:hypothetical protein